MSTLTVYSAAGHAGTSVDGLVYRDADANWAANITGAGTAALPDGTAGYVGANVYVSGATPKASPVQRFICTFDITSLPNTETVTAATLKIGNPGDIYTKLNQIGVSNPAYHVVGVHPTSYTNLADTDYQDIARTTSFGSVAWANLKDDGTSTTDFTLNATGLSYIETARDAGVQVGLALVIEYDVSGSAPAPSTTGYIRWYVSTADDGVGKRPELDITYTDGTPEPTRSALILLRTYP
jgi:hypothetical protein